MYNVCFLESHEIQEARIIECIMVPIICKGLREAVANIILKEVEHYTST